MPLSALTEAERRDVISLLMPMLSNLVRKYDESKYPPSVYADLTQAFSDPTTTTGGDIRRALEWKYGHWQKANYPKHHRDMANRIWARWGAFQPVATDEPRAIFEFWTNALKNRAKQPFITVTFLLHLLRPKQFPIIDQHTFRAMNRLISDVRPGWKNKQTPSTYDDLLTYAEFFDGLLADWPPGRAVTRPDLDKGLMVFGQGLKKPGRA